LLDLDSQPHRRLDDPSHEWLAQPFDEGGGDQADQEGRYYRRHGTTSFSSAGKTMMGKAARGERVRDENATRACGLLDTWTVPEIHTPRAWIPYHSTDITQPTSRSAERIRG